MLGPAGAAKVRKDLLMSSRRVERAIILAAGRGSRLSRGDLLPKPLRPVAGVPLLVRILRTLASVGIREAVVVVGFEGEQIREALSTHPLLGDLTIHFVENNDWDRSNGLSVVAAERFIDRECLLTMADHLIAPELVSRLLRAELPHGACALGVDYDIERCFDLDDATKVRVEGGRIAAIGKELDGYNAIDTGIFRVGPVLPATLRAIAETRGDASLSEGVRALAADGRFVTADVGDARWIDVDTPEAHARAESLLRIYGENLEDELDADAPSHPPDPESLELFAPSWVRAAAPYREDHFQLADREAHTGRGELARLMSNESPFAPSERVVAAVTAALTRGHLYPDAAMTRDLRRRLAEASGLEQEQCVLGAGSSEIIDVLIRTFVSPGEEVVIAVPTFSMYEARTRVAGGVPVLVPMRDDLDLDVPALLNAVTERTKLVFLCSPNNPTGRVISAASLRRVLRLGIPVAVDEAYVEFGDEASVAPSVRDAPNLIVVRTFSKAYGLAGLRIGYALACASVARLLSRVKLPWNVSTLALAAAHAVLDDHDAARTQREHVRSQRAILHAALSKLPGVHVYPSAGNFLLLDIHETAQTADALVQALLAEGVFIRALASHHLRRGWVRVSVGTADENARCVRALTQALTPPRRPRPAHAPLR